LSPLYEGPYRVLEKNQKYFQLDIGGRAEAVSADRLKPHLGPPQQRRRSRCGRPRMASRGSSVFPQLGGVVWRLEVSRKSSSNQRRKSAREICYCS
jgi:hypothetical protein